jgi:hypothetical protein
VRHEECGRAAANPFPTGTTALSFLSVPSTVALGVVLQWGIYSGRLRCITRKKKYDYYSIYYSTAIILKIKCFLKSQGRRTLPTL